MIHNDFEYKIGYNEDSVKFNPEGSCRPGGFYFTTVEHIHRFLDYGNHIREVLLLENSQVYRDPFDYKFKTDRFIVGKIIDPKTIINSDNCYEFFEWTTCNGYREIVKYIIENLEIC